MAASYWPATTSWSRSETDGGTKHAATAVFEGAVESSDPRTALRTDGDVEKNARTNPLRGMRGE